ncbi:hypothetical protein HIM_01130 [Hirsutella minnesotensis 3608]|nr:hypothetical protein HIM_01130 [Hirsutella minnesotensis 3608]
MASLPSQYPTLSIHLADLALTPLITSARSPSHLESLTSLASGALSAHTAAQRAQLGRPQRIMVEYPDAGPVVLQTYLDPCDAAGLVVAGVGPTPVLAAAGGANAPSKQVRNNDQTRPLREVTSPHRRLTVDAGHADFISPVSKSLQQLHLRWCPFKHERGVGGSLATMIVQFHVALLERRHQSVASHKLSPREHD